MGHMDSRQPLPGVEALVFDMFGTVVDWRGGIAREAAPFLSRHAPDVDAGVFADEWRAQYQPSMERVRTGDRPFVRLDVLHRENLEAVLADHDIDPSTIEESELADLNRAWHRLDPWGDVVDGLTRLRQRFILGPLSNANIRLALDIAKRAGIPWDVILGAEVVRAYKPTPESYLRTAEVLGLETGNVALVAAHNSDLAAARAVGMATIFVARPGEHGPGQTVDLTPEDDWDLVTTDFIELADQLGLE